jgi:hypothetical protein
LSSSTGQGDLRAAQAGELFAAELMSSWAIETVKRYCFALISIGDFI